jgi:hypothetical protein
MNKAKTILIFLTIIVFGGCKEPPLIKSKEYSDIVEKTFIERRQLAVNREKELFSVFDKDISVKEKEALKFIFAFMPLSDFADYNGDFFLANADVALKSREETKWGKEIPDYIFLHYVLPLRVNNENLDSFRILYHDEILSRISMLELKDAALEINHWCHEKVSYQAADIRTSSPMATILSARGRCGEESTLVVAALRTAGIPARQVYTPRWAHSDDNHAWVEIWDKGEWYYLGACEPEPVLDRGWFTEPARRAMLIHTKSFGAPYGSENTINKSRYYSEVNNLAKYAITKRIFVKVTDRGGKPCKDATVEFKLYNYAEFYPLASVPTDENGISQLETGLGDLLIWASKNDEFDFLKVSVEDADTVHLKLGKVIPDGTSMDLDLGVPIVRAPYPGISGDLIAKNEQRLKEENNIRQKYIDTWIQSDEVRSISLKRNIDSLRLLNIFSRSMGNYNEIMSFISIVPDTLVERALLLLEVVADKDLRDTKASILTDHLYYCFLPGGKLDDTSVKYILNPRIANEMVVPWRSYFKSSLPDQLESVAKKDPSAIVRYINENIKLSDNENYYKTPLTPVGVDQLKVSDSWSRSICFVAICRTFGIPSRLEEGRLIPQYFFNNRWIDVYFQDQNPPSDKKGFIRITSNETRPVPEYYIHFTLSRLEGGRYVTLSYDYNKKVSDFKDEIPLPPGKYMLLSGNRISDSKILTRLTFFDLKENEHRKLEIKLRNMLAERKNLGLMDTKSITELFPSKDELSASIKEKGVVIIWIDPEKEPTKHIFNDLPLLKTELESWGGFFIFLNGKPVSSDTFKPEALKNLPVNSLFGNDVKLDILNRSVDVKTLPDDKLPFVTVVDKDGKIVFTSVGYRIGIGEQILKYLQ